ncbi:MAG: SoxR reducing system RseC family protein [Candidatus Saccharimonadales bacterium]
MKLLIYIGLTVGTFLGSWLGAIPDHGNWLGGWSILGSLIGGIAGIWVGYKISKNYL